LKWTVISKVSIRISERAKKVKGWKN
jgi:hypothetical protein